MKVYYSYGVYGYLELRLLREIICIDELFVVVKIVRNLRTNLASPKGPEAKLAE